MSSQRPQIRKSIAVVADVVGIGPCYHLGDEAMCEVAIGRLCPIVSRENITLLCSRARTAARTYNVRAVRISTLSLSHLIYRLARRFFMPVADLIKLVWSIHKADLVFFAGGGNLTDLYPKALECRLLVLRLAELMNRPVILASQTIGPLSEVSRSRLLPLLRRAAYIGVRDPAFSATQIGMPVNFAPDDAAFIEPRPAALPTADLAVGISYHPHRKGPQQMDQLLERTAQLIMHLRMQAIFIPHLAATDVPVGIRLERKIGGALRLLAEPPLPGQTMGMCKGLSLVLSTRYHGLIFALASGVPAVGIYCDDYTKAKVEGAYAQFGLPSYGIAMDEVGRLHDAAGAAMAHAGRFSDAAAATRSGLLHANLEPYRLAERILNGGPDT